MSVHSHPVAVSARQHPALTRLSGLDAEIARSEAEMDMLPTHSPRLAQLTRLVTVFRNERDDTIAELRSDFTRTFGDVDMWDFAGRVGC